MRKKFLSLLLVTGFLLLTVSLILPSQGYAMDPPQIPHTLKGMDSCLNCHGEGKLKPVPADHKGRDNNVCTQCHQPKEEKMSEKNSSGDVVSGDVSVFGRYLEGENDSAKFEEYREIPEGAGGQVELKFKKKEGYFFEIEANDIAEDDQNTRVKAGKFGKFAIEFTYDKTPHRFAYDAKSLYAGVGSGSLRMDSGTKTDLLNSASESDRAVRLNSAFRDSAVDTDIQLVREKGKVKIDLLAFDPFSLRAELSREDRKGTRPWSGSFGFHSTVEIPEPIDYETSEARIIGEYAKNPFYLNASFYVADFKNNIDTLTWDNPFRTSDSTSSSAYRAFPDGPAQGLIDLVPDNRYYQGSLSGSITNLPLRSRVSAAASYGWMLQDDRFVAYTTNTAITTGAGGSPFDAFDVSNLPKQSADAEVHTSLYTAMLTSRPLNFLHLKGKYRFYEYDNKTAQIEFPGWVRADAVWEDLGNGIYVTTEPTSYKKHTASGDVSIDLFGPNKATFGYTFTRTEREHREVHEQNEHTLKASFDSRPFSWTDIRLSYEFSSRRGTYDYTVPWERTIKAGDNPSQLPWLRKYDEAARDRNQAQVLATVFPVEQLSVTGSVIYGFDDFVDDPLFGLLKDIHNIYSADVNYAVNDKLTLYAFYSYEKYKNSMKSRQWTAGSVGDPFGSETSTESASNWYNDNEDVTNTFGVGFNVIIIPGLTADLSYTYANSDGIAKFSSVVGGYDNNAFIPVDYSDVDDTNLQTLNAKVKYTFKNTGLSVGLGYMWERLDIEDYNNKGFTNVPTDSSGDFNGAVLMGTLPQNYNVNIAYAQVSYKF
jgi:MtrB/PioB family decaheme-associated outer membrane protein